MKGAQHHSAGPSLIRYLRGGTNSPSGIESGGYRTPVKMVEEDVLVMDGVLVPSANAFRISSGEKTSRKSVNCAVWESFGQCRYGSACQFVHGKEGLHPNLFSVRKKPEVNAGKINSSSSRSYGPNYSLLTPALIEAANKKGSPTRAPEYPCETNYFYGSPCSINRSTPITTPEPLGRSPPVVISGSYNKRPATVVNPEEPKIPVISSENWSPEDDGILVASPAQTDKHLTRKEVDARIEKALYGQSRKKRLPVFTEICPDD